MITPKRTTWFIIADGSQLRLYESAGVKEHWNLIDSKDQKIARKPSHKLGRERPGRGRKVGPDSRFSVNGSEPHEKMETEFLFDLAKSLNKAARDEKFDQLVVAAPPRALGALRAKFQPQLTAKYIGVFDKDLTNMPEAELFEYFKERLVRW